ncbi:DUF6869 domain-containing protein [Stenotrophomonas sp.]|uniref:DUF6869 domain-containing protein n=1 Tax=Stenotrophomonas sp. TaxID=69392 RepID=UPI002FC7FF6B
MNAERVEVNRLAVAWIELNQLPADVEAGVRESYSWVMDVIDDLIQADGVLAWRVIDEIRRINGSDRVLANLAAGPLEDFLVAHGGDCIAGIEEIARHDVQLRKLLAGVWRGRMSEVLWARIRSISTADR